MAEQKRRRIIPCKLIVFVLIIISGLILQNLGLLNLPLIIENGQKYAATWWFPSLIILSKVALYTFALPGSILIWLTGLFYSPLVATVIIVTGGLAGAMSAYFFTRGMSADCLEKTEKTRLFRFMQMHTDFLTLSAIRTLPNFPHFIINYGSGILKVPIPHFFISTLIGFTAKGYLYAASIHHAATAENLSDAVNFRTLSPLFILAALFIAGKFIQRYLMLRRKQKIC